jgi:hypothetical protein
VLCPYTRYPHKCHGSADAAPLTCRRMTYIYSLCDDICGQDISTLTRLEKINRSLPNGVKAKPSGIDSNKYAQVLPHPPNHPILPLHLVLPGAIRSSFLCRIVRPNRSVSGGMQSVCAFLHSYHAAILILPDSNAGEMIRHVSVPTTRSSELRILACGRAVTTRMLKRR